MSDKKKSSTGVPSNKSTIRRTSNTNQKRTHNKPQINSTRPPNNLNKNNKKQKKSSNVFTKNIYILFTIFFIYGIGMLINFFNNSNVDSITLKSIDITKNDTYNGIIIRDEQLYKATNTGYLNIHSKDLEKVKKGSFIFSISESDSTVLSTQLSQVEDELFNYQTFREEYSNNKKELDDIQSNLEKTVNNYSYDSYSEINELTNQINDSLNIRKQLIFSDQRISDSNKIDTRQLLESQIDNNSIKYYSENGGIISYTYDLLEDTITPNNMKDLTLEQTKMDSTFNHHSKIETTVEEPILRIVESNTWYIGTYIDAKDAENLQVSSNRTLFVNLDDNFKEIPAKVYYLSDTIDKKVYVIFEIRSYMQEFINKRNIEVALKKLTYMNMKIPTSALVYKNYLKIPMDYVRETDTSVVIKKIDNELTSATPIIIEYSDESEGYCYIDKEKNDLLVGSILIDPDNPENTYLIPTAISIPGVFKINNGTATYEKVEINEEINTNETDFVYILPSSSLKEYDRILVHGNSTNEGEIID